MGVKRTRAGELVKVVFFSLERCLMGGFLKGKPALI